MPSIARLPRVTRSTSAAPALKEQEDEEKDELFHARILTARHAIMTTEDPMATLQSRLHRRQPREGARSTASSRRRSCACRRASLALTEIPIRDLPLYSYDYDADFPAPARAFKQALEASQALLFVTPEYNRGIPGALKNAIDWAQPAHGKQCVRGQALGGHRHLAGKDRHRGRAAQLHSVLGCRRLAADDLARGLRPVPAGPDRRRGQGQR